ncbi:uncharacterized protein LOC134750641 [Cydia strobilella]|uniref:uncharacterized protein LOC134750641 n=1 Tax=Cydia strobilella TaxID=1100964 RepID=UPI003006C5D7
MLYICQVTLVLLALVSIGSADLMVESLDAVPLDDVADTDVSKDNIPHATPNQEEAALMPEIMAHAMEEFMAAAELGQKMAQDGIHTQEETEKQYVKMAQLLEEMLHYMYSANNAYSFLQAKGLNTIIVPNMHITFSQLRTSLLQLLKALFDIAPTTTVTAIPDTILDKLVDIYEQDDDLDIKIHAIELLSVWLPGNPQAQTRVMKMKGLLPFYKQLAKLDPLLTKLTLELFNKIMNEHIAARNKKLQKNKADYKTFQRYQQMGLIERLSTPLFCNGLLKIFEAVFSTGSEHKDTKDLLPPVLKLLQVIKPHCSRVYNGRSKVETLINQVLEKVQEPSTREDLEKQMVNVTEVIESLTEFAELVKLIDHTEL